MTVTTQDVENLVALVLSVATVIFLILCIVYPERF